MRPIKFRSWISSIQEFVYFENGEYSHKNADGVSVFNWDNAEQFTGLKDKFEVDIYEEDILTIFTPVEEWNTVVKYLVDTKVLDGTKSNRATGFFMVSDNGALHLSTEGCSSIGISGNIHQNPDII